MNWTEILNEVLAMSSSDDAKSFFLGVGLAAGVRVIRTGIRWLKRIDTDSP